MPLPDGVIVSAFSADGGGVGPQPGLGGLLASGTFLHDFDGAPVLRDGGTFEFPPTYLALPLTTAAPVAALRLTTSALRIEEISVW